MAWSQVNPNAAGYHVVNALRGHRAGYQQIRPPRPHPGWVRIRPANQRAGYQQVYGSRGVPTPTVIPNYHVDPASIMGPSGDLGPANQLMQLIAAAAARAQAQPDPAIAAHIQAQQAAQQARLAAINSSPTMGVPGGTDFSSVDNTLLNALLAASARRSY